MKYKIELLIVVSAVFCLVLAQAAPASNTMKTLYIDGVKINDTNNNTGGLSFGSNRITIGAEGIGYLYNEYRGMMDEFAIYAGVLSAGRIKAHYDANANYTNYKSAVQADAPLLWLKFDDASMADTATAKNSGSVARDGNYVQTGGSPFVQGLPGFNAESNDVNFPDTVAAGSGHAVSVLDNGEFGENLNGDVTVELWANFTSFNDSNYPDSDWSRLFTHNGGYGAMISAPNEIGIMGGDAVNYIGFPNAINNGQWHHIVVTYDSTYDQPNIPPAGTYVEEVNKDNPVLWLRFEDTQPKDYSAADGNHWVGYGAGLSIVNKVGGVGKSAYLSGSNPSYAAATNNPNSPPVVGGSYAVFGDQYAFAPNDITFEIWYKASSQSDYPYFFQQVGSSGNEPCAPAVGDSGGNIRIWGGSTAWYTGVDPKFDQKWHHLVVTYDEQYSGDANMFVQLYLDGAFKGSRLFTGARAKLGPELSHIMVGARNDMGSTYNAFKGYVDEFAIYAGILDPNRVMAHYSAWQPHNCAEYLNKELGLAGDVDKDCKVDLYDFAELALDWRRCNEPNKPDCSPNW